MNTLILATLVATTAAQKASLVWTQSEDAAMYIGAAVSAHAGTTPTFGVATWLNPPVYVEIFNTTDNGGSIWAFTGNSSDSSMTLDMARHSIASSGTALPIDTFVLEVTDFGDLANCIIRGFASYGPSATGSPVWEHTIGQCEAGIWDGTSIMLLESDDAGAVVALLVDAADNATAPTTAHLEVYDGQTGALRFARDLNGLSASDGQIAVTPSGHWVLFMAADDAGGYLYVLNGTTGAIRGSAPIRTSFQDVAISADGDTLAVGLAGSTEIYSWTGSAYTASSPIPAPGGMIVMQVQFAGAGATLAVVIAYATETFLGARIQAVDATTLAVVTDWSAPTNAQLQNNVAMRTSGKYIGAAVGMNSHRN